MAVTKLIIENFKGVSTRETIEIKPITVFVGPNSSGKSTCLHALAALSQTVKLPNNYRALLLDDEYAFVHLGRFIEVVHSRSYDDAITLGVELDDVRYYTTDKDGKMIQATPQVASACFSFKSTKRTQELYLLESHYRVGQDEYTSKKIKDQHRFEHSGSGRSLRTKLTSGFSFDFPFSSKVDLDALHTFLPLVGMQSSLTNALTDVAYLGPFRQSPKRRYQTRGAAPREVGPEGESTITLLANEVVQSQSRKHITEIADWLRLLGVGKKLDVARVASSDLFDLNITLNDNTTFSLADLGYGLSQVLPVLAQCSFAPNGATLLFEQPEIHLHTLAAKNLVRVFLDSIQKRNYRIVMETHSPDIIHQIQTELRSGALSVDDVAIYRVARQNSHSQFTRLQLEDDFSIYEHWEKGITMG